MDEYMGISPFQATFSSKKNKTKKLQHVLAEGLSANIYKLVSKEKSDVTNSEQQFSALMHLFRYANC